MALVAGLFAAVRWPRPSPSNQSTATPASQLSGDERRAAVEPDTKRDILMAERDARLAPAIASGEWINSGPLKLEALRGRVRFTHIGEGLYQEQENIIKELLAE